MGRKVRRWALEADDNMRDSPIAAQALLSREKRRRLLALVAQAEASPLAAMWPLSADLSELKISSAKAPNSQARVTQVAAPASLNA